MEKDKLTETIPAETLLEKGFKTVLSMLRAKIQDRQRTKGNQEKKIRISTSKQKLLKGSKH